MIQRHSHRLMCIRSMATGGSLNNPLADAGLLRCKSCVLKGHVICVACYLFTNTVGSFKRVTTNHYFFLANSDNLLHHWMSHIIQIELLTCIHMMQRQKTNKTKMVAELIYILICNIWSIPYSFFILSKTPCGFCIFP